MSHGHDGRTRRRSCPMCGQPVTWSGNPSRPFCSIRCKLIDLGTWLDERYRVSGEPAASAPLGDEDPRDVE